MEEKDRPKRKEFHEEGGTLLLLLHLTKSLFGTGKFVILDSGLFVLKFIVFLKKRGVYASSLIKNVAVGSNIFMGMVFKPS